MRMIGATGTGTAVVEMEMGEVEQFRVALHTLETMAAALSSMRVLRVGGTDGAALMGELPRVEVDRGPAPELAPKKTVRGKMARVPVAKTSAGPMRDKVCLGCGCRVGDLMPCDDPVMECRPGYIRYGAFEGGMTWMIVEQSAPRQPEPPYGERVHALVGPGGGG